MLAFMMTEECRNREEKIFGSFLRNNNFAELSLLFCYSFIILFSHLPVIVYVYQQTTLTKTLFHFLTPLPASYPLAGYFFVSPTFVGTSSGMICVRR
ncbi:hypothetical protein IGI37_000441 [Enterococcus sp. AZ194]